MIDSLSSVPKSQSWNYFSRVFFSFILVVLVLDIVWSVLSNNSAEQNAEQLWQEVFLNTVNETFKFSNPESYDQFAAELSNEIGFSVLIDPLNEVHIETPEEPNLAQHQSVLAEIGDETYLLATYPETGIQIRVGPLPSASNHLLTPAITLGFYSLIALLIWFWMRPIIVGLDKLSQSAQRFAQNYQEPLPELNVKPPVQELATSIESMAKDIRALIQTQIELTGGLSHEIRTPLARIKFALASARTKVGDQSQFESIEQDVDELEHLVEAMLDYCRLQQTQKALQRKTFDSAKTLNDLAEKYRWRTSAAIKVDCATNAIMDADARLMPLAISNLLVNATRYAKKNIILSFNSGEGEQSVSIEDDGPGIPEELREAATQPFKKNACLNDESDGFGLGLAIVSRIAELHEGRVHLSESDLGGLNVTVFWPTKTGLGERQN